YARETAFSLVELLDRLDRLHHLILHRKHLAFETVFADSENALLHFIEKIAHLILLLVSPAHALCGGRDDLPKNVFIANDLEVVLHVRGRWNEREQIRDGCRPAHAFE